MIKVLRASLVPQLVELGEFVHDIWASIPVLTVLSATAVIAGCYGTVYGVLRAVVWIAHMH